MSLKLKQNIRNNDEQSRKKCLNILKLTRTTILAVSLILSNWWFAFAENFWSTQVNKTVSKAEEDKKIQEIKKILLMVDDIGFTQEQWILIKEALLNYIINKNDWWEQDFYNIELNKIQIKSIWDYQQILDWDEDLNDIQVEQMNFDNFIKIMDSLFKIEENKESVKKHNWTNTNEEVLREYKKNLFVQSIYMKKVLLSYDDKTRLEFLSHWFKLFNDWISKSISKSRVVQRLILSSSFGIVLNKYPTEEMKNATKEEFINYFNFIATQAWRYEILTSNWKILWLQITIDFIKTKTHFFLVWWDSLTKYNIPWNYYCKLVNNYIKNIETIKQELKEMLKKKSKWLEV